MTCNWLIEHCDITAVIDTGKSSLKLPLVSSWLLKYSLDHKTLHITIVIASKSEWGCDPIERKRFFVWYW